MTTKFSLLSMLAFLSSVSPCRAEGQSGLGTFIAIVYIFSFLVYTIIGGLLIKLFFKIFKVQARHLKWMPFVISFCLTMILLLTMGDTFVLFFW